ncbi:hypothetical protein B0I35DRAFT_474834 [Stachybotrys elegans]|uniref:Uncharacterized protein n=1 Tax=Stachybotrys elegans TaxID=80388 RepID=A0A8K0WWR8_9HYPO|nr:hypothetical protein B0I35DRAFT_474834 [Stachybotrys elegans]
MACLRTVLANTALSFVANLNNYTGPEVFLNGRTPDALHTVLPRTAAFGGPPELPNEAVVGLLRGLVPGLRDWSLNMTDSPPMFIDEEQRMVSMHAFGQGMTDLGPYSNEYQFILITTEDGTLIERSWEIVDSLLVVDFVQGNSTEHR